MSDVRDLLGHGARAVTSRVVPHIPMTRGFADARIDNIRQIAERAPESLPWLKKDCGCPARKMATVREAVSELLLATGRDPEADMPEWVLAGEARVQAEAEQRERERAEREAVRAALASPAPPSPVEQRAIDVRLAAAQARIDAARRAEYGASPRSQDGG